MMLNSFDGNLWEFARFKNISDKLLVYFGT